MALFEEKVVILIASFVASDEPIFHSFRLRDQYFFYRMERGGGGGGVRQRFSDRVTWSSEGMGRGISRRQQRIKGEYRK